MYLLKKHLVTPIIALSVLTACATQEEKLIEAGAVRLSQQQVLAHVTGNTEIWSKGGGYYQAEGKMQAVWEGVKTDRTYHVAENGELCIYGKRTFCHFYMNDNGSIIMISERKNFGELEMRPGDHLSQL